MYVCSLKDVMYQNELHYYVILELCPVHMTYICVKEDYHRQYEIGLMMAVRVSLKLKVPLDSPYVFAVKNWLIGRG